MYVGALLASVYVCVPCVWCPQRPEEDAMTTGTGITVVSYHVGALSRDPLLWYLSCHYYSHSWNSE